jgi:uncharacterized protein (TIGR02421 family)
VTREREHRAVLRADALLARIARGLRLLPHVTPENAVAERRRMVEALRKGDGPTPRWTYAGRFAAKGVREEIREARRALGRDPLGTLYRARLRELRLQIELCERIGARSRVLVASRRLWGSVDASVRSLALAWLSAPASPAELRDVPAVAPRGCPSLVTALRGEMLEYGVLWPIRVEPRLAAAAAIGAGEVLLGGTRLYSRAEVQRLAAHEVGVHLVAHENAREQPLAIFAIGTCGATRDQEGIALWAEVARGAFTPYRRRILAARTLAVSLCEEGASFADAARALVGEHDLGEEDAVIACERAYRGGGLTKDAVYLAGFLRVGRALAKRTLDLEAMSVGRVGLGDAPLVRTLFDEGLLVVPRRASREMRRLEEQSGWSAFEAIA